ncbi:MAG: hypothetical protein V1892_00295 [bacterium]
MNLANLRKRAILVRKKLKRDRFLGILVMLILVLEWANPHLAYAQSISSYRPNVFIAENKDILLSKINLEEQEKEIQIAASQEMVINSSTLPIKVKRAIRVVVTAYSSTPDQTDSTPFITASGSQVRDGVIAANFLRFGTKVRFPNKFGAKIFVVEDRMNPRHPNRVDIWMTERQLAKEFGIRRLEMEILEN